MKPEEIRDDAIARLKYRIAYSQENLPSYFAFAFIEGFFLWIIFLFGWSALLDSTHATTSLTNNISITLLFAFLFLVIQSSLIYQYRSGSKYIFQNTVRMLGGAETKYLRKRGKVNRAHDLAEYYWLQFETLVRNGSAAYPNHTDDIFDIAKGGFNIENLEMVGIDDVAFAIELNLAKESSKFKDSEEGSWLPFNNYAKRYIDKFGDSEPPLWEWFCFLLKEYEGLDKDVKRQGLKEGDESRFAKWRGEVEDHTTFYGFLGKVIISIAIILIIIFEPEILKLFPLSP